MILNRVQIFVLAALLGGGGICCGQPILVETEAFDEPGGWLLDTQFIETMGSPYRIAHGLGTPVEVGLLTTGNISTSGSSGEADLAIPISGPKGGATVYVVASKSEGEWIFSTLVVGLKEGGERINLLE